MENQNLINPQENNIMEEARRKAASNDVPVTNSVQTSQSQKTSTAEPTEPKDDINKENAFEKMNCKIKNFACEKATAIVGSNKIKLSEESFPIFRKNVFNKRKIEDYLNKKATDNYKNTNDALTRMVTSEQEHIKRAKGLLKELQVQYHLNKMEANGVRLLKYNIRHAEIDKIRKNILSGDTKIKVKLGYLLNIKENYLNFIQYRKHRKEQINSFKNQATRQKNNLLNEMDSKDFLEKTIAFSGDLVNSATKISDLGGYSKEINNQIDNNINFNENDSQNTIDEKLTGEPINNDALIFNNFQNSSENKSDDDNTITSMDNETDSQNNIDENPTDKIINGGKLILNNSQTPTNNKIEEDNNVASMENEKDTQNNIDENSTDKIINDGTLIFKNPQTPTNNKIEEDNIAASIASENDSLNKKDNENKLTEKDSFIIELNNLKNKYEEFLDLLSKNFDEINEKLNEINIKIESLNENNITNDDPEIFNQEETEPQQMIQEIVESSEINAPLKGKIDAYLNTGASAENLYNFLGGMQPTNDDFQYANEKYELKQKEKQSPDFVEPSMKENIDSLCEAGFSAKELYQYLANSENPISEDVFDYAENKVNEVANRSETISAGISR